MPIRVRYQNDPNQECTIRPTPFIQISSEVLKNKEGSFGVTYNITLTGTLLPDEGTPYALDPATNNPVEFFPGQTPPEFIGPYNLFDKVPLSQRSRPPRQKVTKSASAILSKQRALKALFAKDGQRVEVTDIFDNAGATVVCNPRVVSVDFTEGAYVTKCEYTIVLQADVLYRQNGHVDLDAQLAASGVQAGAKVKDELSLINFVDDEAVGGGATFIESYDENWGLEVDDSVSESFALPRTYRISHSLNATGKTFYNEDGSLGKEAWEQARDFCLRRITDRPSGNYPNVAGLIGSGTVNLVDTYRGYNHTRTEQINQTAGSYSVTENWLLASGISHENYSMSVSSSNTDPFVSVSIDGVVKGLNEINPSGYGSSTSIANSGAYKNALLKYNQISNSGRFGLSSDLYKRANNTVAVALNSQPTSVSLGTNEFTGEISYSLAFNNRPTNIVSGVIAESIQVNDTYPGDVFAVIPVLGRATGPVLQYIGGRTEYKRDVSINLTMDYTKVPYGSGRNTLLLKKPSLVEPTATQIADLLKELSPQGEFGVRKYFISPPSESWSPKEGTYSFNVSFTYELDK